MTGIFLTQTQQEVVACFSKNKNTRSRHMVAPTTLSGTPNHERMGSTFRRRFFRLTDEWLNEASRALIADSTIRHSV